MSIKVHSSGIRGYLDVMQDIHFDPEPLLHSYQLNKELIAQDDAWLSQRDVIDLLESTALHANCPDLGLRISSYQDIGILGILGLILQSASSIREAVQYSSDFLYLHGPGLILTLNEHSPIENTVEINFEIRLKERIPQRQTIDICLGTTHRIFKWLSGENYRLKAVSLPHTPICPIGTYQRFFSAPVQIEQKRAALYIDKYTLACAPHDTNPALREMAQDYLARYLRASGEKLSARVRKALSLHLSTSRSNKPQIAEMLSLHPRTLQRKLKQEGTSFEALKEELLKELALQYLWETQIPINQLAGILGFSEQSAFSRTVKRWFGISPKEVRNSKQ